MRSTPTDVLEPLNIQSAATRNKIGRAMKAHGIVALRKQLNERGARDLPDLSTTHQAILSGLTPTRLVHKRMTRKEWAEHADYVLEVAKDAQKSAGEYKLRVRQRCKAELAEVQAVHRHMPRHRGATQRPSKSTSKSARKGR
jgi:hypothetical protein